LNVAKEAAGQTLFASELKASPEISKAISLEGKSFMEMKNFRKACDSFRLALSIRKEGNADPLDVALANANLGMALFQSGSDPNAMSYIAKRLKADSKKYLDEAWETFSKAGLELSAERKLEKADLALYLAQYEHSVGNLDSVLVYFDTALDIKKSILKSHPDVSHNLFIDPL
jgi:tetratricopeptide (TPR) repeat protein